MHNQYAMIDHNPLIEIETMLNNYNGLEEHYKDLMDYHYLVVDSENDFRFLMLGKELEIINAIFPISGKTDTRIKCHFPDLISKFKDITIKKLIEWSNCRKQTRHYVRNKQDVISHPPFTNKEAEKYFDFIDTLVVATVRNVLIPSE